MKFLIAALALSACVCLNMAKPRVYGSSYGAPALNNAAYGAQLQPAVSVNYAVPVYNIPATLHNSGYGAAAPSYGQVAPIAVGAPSYGAVAPGYGAIAPSYGQAVPIAVGAPSYGAIAPSYGQAAPIAVGAPSYGAAAPGYGAAAPASSSSAAAAAASVNGNNVNYNAPSAAY